MKEDLYKKYLKNIVNGKTAIKKEYVDRGFFSYYSKREINNHLNSKRILIDGVNGNLNSFIKTIICDFDREGVVPNKVLYLGKVGKQLFNRVREANPDEKNIIGYNISISGYEIIHTLNNHGKEIEKYRGQNIVTENDLCSIVDLLNKSYKVLLMGKNALNLNVYNFVSTNYDGTYNTIEFVGNGKHLLGFQSLYINKKRFTT